MSRAHPSPVPDRHALAASALLVAVALTLTSAGSASAQTRGYYRWPAERKGTIVFTAEGDLWTVPRAGGAARRLTTHPAEETQAVLSADGKTVAFVAAYDGGPDVYVMPIDGGAPTRLTWEASRVWLSGFDPSGAVVYATEATVGPPGRRALRAVDPATGGTRTYPLADAYDASFEPGGDGLWFTRFGLAATGDNVRGYRGGAMAELWRWSTRGDREATRVGSEWGVNLTRPMAWGGRLYVVADVDEVANLWSISPDGQTRERLTRHRDVEVRGARLGDGVIVYQHGADLRLFDLASGKDTLVPITLVTDLEQRRERVLRKPLAFVDAVSFAPSGERVLLSARGYALVAGLGPLRRVELTPPAGARLRSPVLAPDGKSVYALVDAAANTEVWRFPADGSPGGQALTRDGQTHRWRLQLSPDGKWLAHDDARGRLWLTSTADGKTHLADTAPVSHDEPYPILAWSPDGKWAAFCRADTPAERAQLILIPTEGGAARVLTSDKYESRTPAFSRDGRWLYFLSDRTFVVTPRAPWGDRNTGPFFDKRTKVYALGLQAGQRSPFQPKDELAGAKKDDAAKKDENGKKDDGAKKDASPALELDGLAERLFEVPLAAGNYGGLWVDADRLYLLDRDAAPSAKPLVRTLAISADAPPSEVFATDVAQLALSADAKKVLVVKAVDNAPIGDVLIVDAGAKLPSDVSKAQVKLSDWTLAVEPEVEWRQMFDDAWRMHRAFAFDPAMRGQDWDAVRMRWAPLLGRVTDRAELDDLLAQMIGELGLLHSQIRAGEYRSDPESVQAAGLGAVFEEGPKGVTYARSYRTEAELPSERAPLEQPGVDARPGDRVLAIDGRPVERARDVARLLRQRAGQQVLVRLARGDAAPHEVIVTPVPLDREATLRYGDWVADSRARVQTASRGRFGYLHLRAMGSGDIAGFVRELYGQLDKEGLVIDVRRNRGGNIDSWVLEKLLRRAWAFWQSPGSAPYWNMQQSFRGHVVVLTDPLTYSDGETFAAGFKALGLGPVIGRRTAGAGVWLSDRNRLADGGAARIAESPQFDAEGRWLIEGTGVEPDVTVDATPWATARGEDAQLAAAIQALEAKARAAPVRQPPAETLPKRGRGGHDARPGR